MWHPQVGTVTWEGRQIAMWRKTSHPGSLEDPAGLLCLPGSLGIILPVVWGKGDSSTTIFPRSTWPQNFHPSWSAPPNKSYTLTLLGTAISCQYPIPRKDLLTRCVLHGVIYTKRFLWRPHACWMSPHEPQPGQNLGQIMQFVPILSFMAGGISIAARLWGSLFSHSVYWFLLSFLF